jgi:NAD(P)-dependent dehydrogenase (short-subunit alcohol dehydrogenase family)
MQMFDLTGVEWADRDVRVDAISPGVFVTEMTRPRFDTLGLARWIESRTPMRRVGVPGEG